MKSLVPYQPNEFELESAVSARLSYRLRALVGTLLVAGLTLSVFLLLRATHRHAPQAEPALLPQIRATVEATVTDVQPWQEPRAVIHDVLAVVANDGGSVYRQASALTEIETPLTENLDSIALRNEEDLAAGPSWTSDSTTEELSSAVPNAPVPIADVEEVPSPIPEPNLEDSVQPNWSSPSSDESFDVGRPLLPMQSVSIVTLDQLLVASFSSAPRIRVFSDEPLVEESRISEEAAAFDWRSFIETQWNDTSEPVGNTLVTGGANRLRENDWRFNSGVRRRMLSGGAFEIGQELGHTNSNSDFFFPQNQGTSRLVISYQQPLLRGRGRAFNQSRVILADLRYQGSKFRFVADLQDYVFDIVAAYWEYYFQRAALVQSQYSLSRAEEIVTKLRAREGIDSDLERVMRAESAAAARRSAVVANRTSVKNAQEQLLSLVFGPDFVDFADTEIIPGDHPFMSSPVTALPDEVSAAIANRPEVSLAIAELRSQMVRRNVARNELLPRLDMFLDTYVAGLRGDSNIGGALQDQFSEAEPGYSVGLTFEVPWRNRAARSRNNRAKVELRILENQFRQTISEVALDVRTAYREVQRLEQDYSIRSDALNKARRELRYLETRFRLRVDRDRNGALYLEDLLESQERLSDAELNYLRTQVDYAISGVALRRANGMLLRDMDSPACQQCDFQTVDSQTVDAGQLP